MKEKDPTKSPVWNESASALKLIVRATSADTALLFLEQEGNVACMVEATSNRSHDSILLTLKLFQERLNELVDQLDSGTLKMKTEQMNQVFLRSEDGGFEEKPFITD